MKTLIIGAAAVAACWSVSASAGMPEKAPEGHQVVTEMDMHVTAVADEFLSKVFDGKHADVLKVVAYQHVVAEVCEGFDIDQARSDAQLDFVFGAIGELPQEQRRAASEIALMGFAAYAGGQHAIAAYDYDAYCAHAREERALDVGSNAHIIWKVED